MNYLPFLTMYKVSTLFWGRKTGDKQHVSIYMRVVVGGRRLGEWATGHIVPRAMWLVEQHRVSRKYKTSQINGEDINTYLDGLERLVRSKHMILCQEGVMMEARHVLEVLHPPVVKVPTFGALVAEYMASNKASGDKPNTVKNRNSRATILATVAAQTRLASRPVNALNGRDGATLVAALQRLGGELDTARRVLHVAKAVLQGALQAGHLDFHPWMGLRMEGKEKAKPVKSLTGGHVARMRTLDLDGKVDHVRHLFLAAVATGMAYADLPQLIESNVQVIKGVQMLVYARTKNGHVAWVPVTDEIQAYFRRWPQGPDTKTNPHCNRKLKEIGKAIGASFPLTMHHGRKTCATLLAQSGMSYEAIALIMGHTDTRTTTKHYITRGPEILLAELAKAEKV